MILEMLNVAVPLTASMPTNGRSPREPVETEESNKLKYIVGISAAVFVVFRYCSRSMLLLEEALR